MSNKPGFQKPLSERLKEATAKADNSRAPQSAVPTAPASPNVSRALNFHFSPTTALKLFLGFGVIGVGIYTARSFINPLKNLAGFTKDLAIKAVKAPFQINNRYPNWKGKTAAITLAATEGWLGYLGVSKIHDGYENLKIGNVPSFMTTSRNVNSFLLGGLTGGVVKILGANYERSQEGRGDWWEVTQLYASDVSSAAGNLASWASNKIPPAPKPFTNTNAPIAYDGEVEVCLLPAPTNGNPAKYSNYFSELDNKAGWERVNRNSDLNQAFQNSNHVQVIASPYSDPNITITVTNSSGCPKNYESFKYDAQDYMSSGGFIPKGLKPL